MISRLSRQPSNNAALTANTPAARAREQVATAATAATGRVSIAEVWQDALSTFGAHAAAIVLCALVGFAAPVMIGALGAVALDRPLPTPALLAALILSVVGFTFACSVITWKALHAPRPAGESESCGSGSFGEGIRVTVARAPALLVGNLFYGVVVTVGILGLSELTRPLEYTYRHSSMTRVWAGPLYAFDQILRQLAWRAVSVFIPDPGPPFAESMPELRQTARARLNADAPAIRAAPEFGSAYGVERQPAFFETFSAPADTTESRLFTLSGALLILIAETLLRLRTVMALKPPGSQRPRRFWLLAPLLASARLGFRHFATITVHVWVVRLALFALSVVFIEFPLVMADNLLAPFARPWERLEILPIMDLPKASAAAMVGATLLAFSVVYDARLAVHLEPTISNPQSPIS